MPDLFDNPPIWVWASGYDDVQWSDECVPHSDYLWPRMEVPPVVGGRYGLWSTHRLPCDSFWVLFRPNPSALNGWSEYPAELGSSCVVCCRWERGLGEFDCANGKMHGEAVTVTKVVPIHELTRLIPAIESGPVPEVPTRTTYRTDWEDLTLFECSVEGDFGGYVACQNLNGKHTLLLYSEFDFGPSYFWAGNRPLSNAEYRMMEDYYRS
jgi:hypothetical protein